MRFLVVIKITFKCHFLFLCKYSLSIFSLYILMINGLLIFGDNDHFACICFIFYMKEILPICCEWLRITNNKILSEQFVAEKMAFFV